MVERLGERNGSERKKVIDIILKFEDYMRVFLS